MEITGSVGKFLKTAFIGEPMPRSLENRAGRRRLVKSLFIATGGSLVTACAPGTITEEVKSPTPMKHIGSPTFTPETPPAITAERIKAELEVLPCDENGRVDPEMIQKAMGTMRGVFTNPDDIEAKVEDMLNHRDRTLQIAGSVSKEALDGFDFPRTIIVYLLLGILHAERVYGQEADLDNIMLFNSASSMFKEYDSMTKDRVDYFQESQKVWEDILVVKKEGKNFMLINVEKFCWNLIDDPWGFYNTFYAAKTYFIHALSLQQEFEPEYVEQVDVIEFYGFQIRYFERDETTGIYYLKTLFHRLQYAICSLLALTDGEIEHFKKQVRSQSISEHTSIASPRRISLITLDNSLALFALDHLLEEMSVTKGDLFYHLTEVANIYAFTELMFERGGCAFSGNTRYWFRVWDMIDNPASVAVLPENQEQAPWDTLISEIDEVIGVWRGGREKELPPYRIERIYERIA